MLLALLSVGTASAQTGRDYWLATLLKMCDPIYENLSRGTLRKNMPVETTDGFNTGNDRKDVTHLEALGRSLAGLGPWLNLPADDTPEGRRRAEYVTMVVRALDNAVDPASPDYMPFDRPTTQPLVDAAYVAEGLLRSRDAVWPRLSDSTKQRLIREFKASRRIKAPDKNWLMFSATVEAALLEFTGECDMRPIEYALMRHEEWYKGDAWYGDGRRLHMDFYNSFVIHPMLVDVLDALKRKGISHKMYDSEMTRFTRMAEQLERMVAPDGSYPIIGRSICYRTGAFQVLAQAALLGRLPRKMNPAQVRCAMEAVMRRVLVTESFSKDGWLLLGVRGHQPALAEKYVSTGSLYMATLAFLPLGLPADHPFWTSADCDWTQKKVWRGDADVKIDHALRD